MSYYVTNSRIMDPIQFPGLGAKHMGAKVAEKLACPIESDVKYALECTHLSTVELLLLINFSRFSLEIECTVHRIFFPLYGVRVTSFDYALQCTRSIEFRGSYPSPDDLPPSSRPQYSIGGFLFWIFSIHLAFFHGP